MRFIQLGNAKQCDANGVNGWEYCIGFQSVKTLGSSKWACQRRKEKGYWTVRPEHATRFRLFLQF